MSIGQDVLQQIERRRPQRPRRDRYEPVFVPVRDAFEMIGVGPTLGYELVNAGLLTVIKISRQKSVIAYAELKALPDQLRAAAGEGAPA